MLVEDILFASQVKIYKNPKKKEAGQEANFSVSWPQLAAPNWTGSLEVLANGSELYISIVEAETHRSFGKCPIDQYPRPAVERVKNYPRHFVLKFFNGVGQTANLGIEFEDQNDCIEFSTVIQKHFQNLSKKRTAPKKKKKKIEENNQCKSLVATNTASSGGFFSQHFIDSLADKMAEKYGGGGGGDTTSNAEVIDLSCMQVVKSRRRSVPVKYVPPPKPAAAGEGGAATKRSKSTASITFTQQEVINVTPSCSTPVGKTPRNTTNTTTTISLGLDDSSSSRPTKLSSRTAAKLSKQEYHYQLDELHTSLLQGDAELADLLCCLVHTTMNGSPCLTPPPAQVPLPKLPTHSYPVFHFVQNRVPFFILFREDFVSTCAEELRSPAELLKDVDEEMLQKSRSIYEFLLKHQARQRRRQHFANIEGQITLLRLYYRTLLQDERALEEARQSLQTRYENDWPNPRIFDVIVQVDEHSNPSFKFFAFPKSVPFDLQEFLTNYDPTILSYSKSIYELIYQEHLSSTSSETVSNM